MRHVTEWAVSQKACGPVSSQLGPVARAALHPKHGSSPRGAENKLCHISSVELKTIVCVNMCELAAPHKLVLDNLFINFHITTCTVAAFIYFFPLGVESSPTDQTWSLTSLQGPPGFALSPQLAPKSQMQEPRQGCTSLGNTETPLCSGSWSPDALIETVCPCRNQREGKGEHGRGCEHIWHLKNPAHSCSYHQEINVQAIKKKKSRKQTYLKLACWSSTIWMKQLCEEQNKKAQPFSSW